MKKISLITAALFSLGLFMAPAVFAAGEKAVGERTTLLMADDLVGSEVLDRNNEKIGEIDKLLVDLQQGKIGYVVMKSGGILGVGTDRYVVPFNAFEGRAQITDQMIGEKVSLTLNRSKDQLRAIPENDIQAVLSDRTQGAEIHQFYGVSPYWEDDRGMTQDRPEYRKDKDKDKDKDKRKY
ncbi:PRC-barrel domain-containing protein [Geoalkalibacter ferrihydriticus]|uniref:PRC-barrel domain-containing protein n=2 Tax=Geoalkalibacter ferrihydriticus TaxID=392333 RepID=A0A0C2EBQ8_9BACT|nr:PRC-barrel domain-containing protein [Geoalkalibacter ferrihydriticus]KIH76003.1 hypothetical protein GFER_14015 [Geoalkalibacter ferrihydriticus DSM 17813]SDM97563.1 PRC-barrel domain-containing protein [Geoalkalibacter ferrihydriticus]